MTDIDRHTDDDSDRLTRETAVDAMFGSIDLYEAEMQATINGHSTVDSAADDAPAVTLETLATEPVWVAWQLQTGDRDKPTKVPYSPTLRGRAKADNPRTWGTRAEAEKRFATLPKPFGVGGVGIEFCASEEGWSIGGIDLDTCRCNESGDFAPWAVQVMDLLQSYTEISPSGSGAKIFFLFRTEDLDDLRALMGGSKYGKAFKWSGKEHPPAIEVHLGNRYFAVTGDTLPGFSTEFRRVPTDLVVNLLAVVGPDFVKAGKAAEEARAAQEATSKAEERAEKKARTESEKEQRKAERKERHAADRSRSAIAFAKGKQLRRDGKTFEEMVKALLQDPLTSEWTREKGQAADQRELKRIWSKAVATGPVIKIEPGELHIQATATEDALIKAGLPIYQRGRNLVQPISVEVPASRGRMTRAAALGNLNVHSVIDMACGVAEYEKYDARSDDYVRCDPPQQVAQILLAREGKWRFPVVSSIITTPTLRPDGSLLVEPGYDPATKVYHMADPTLQLYPAVHKPTREFAEKGLNHLLSLVKEFPFADDVSKSVGLSALITPIVRSSMSVAPLHELSAPTPGSGKSYLADVASTIYSGRPCPVVRASEDPKETEKALAGLLLAGHPLISLDNCNGEIGSDLLAQAVERPLIQIRLFSTLDVFEVASAATILANGNNARVRADLVRRTIRAMLDAKMERPELRQFKSDPVARVMADRGRYVSACLIIVRAYIEAGMPNAPAPLASFADWSNLVRGSLIWLGCADPLKSMDDVRQDDPALTDLQELMVAWEGALGNHDYTAKEVVQRIDLQQTGDYGTTNTYTYPELREIIFRQFGDRSGVNTRKFGNWLADQKGRIVGGRRFSRAVKDAPGGVAKWRIERLKP